MGAKSTKQISRQEALNFIADRLHEMDNQQLAAILEEVNDQAMQRGDHYVTLGLYNFEVVD